jgi:hypothetical protein
LIVEKEGNMYIDPNSGGLIFQILVVLFGVISGAVLIFSSKIKMGVSKIQRRIREKYTKTETTESVANKEK